MPEYAEDGTLDCTYNVNLSIGAQTDSTVLSLTSNAINSSGKELFNETYNLTRNSDGTYACTITSTSMDANNTEANAILSELENILYTYVDPVKYGNLHCSGVGGTTSDPVFQAYQDAQARLTSAERAFTPEEFEAVKNALMLDNIMSTYGEPKWAWIDTTAPTDSYNENGEAKAQWYTNLFERMQKGYKVLQDGLASSTEWIQFALESGIVTMEQVDSDNHWIATNYTNCSDITEQTNNAAATLAEAEYNAAMNKIENKDKKYDLELKNIDTEHNSLQTEYDSIKSAIDKNIERTFKIYS